MTRPTPESMTNGSDTPQGIEPDYTLAGIKKYDHGTCMLCCKCECCTEKERVIRELEQSSLLWKSRLRRAVEALEKIESNPRKEAVSEMTMCVGLVWE